MAAVGAEGVAFLTACPGQSDLTRSSSLMSPCHSTPHSGSASAAPQTGTNPGSHNSRSSLAALVGSATFTMSRRCARAKQVSVIVRRQQSSAQDQQSPEEVAQKVEFVHVTKGRKDKHGLPTVKLTPYEGPRHGLKVNIVAGPTGSGKTSLVHILAGGMEVPSKVGSDTKRPIVYILKIKRQNCVFLDTAGLCDTEATAMEDVGLQELLINSVAATIKQYDMEVVSFFMCVDVASRIPGNFCEVWPQMQVALGGERLNKLCRFVVTKVNAESRTDKAKIKAMEEEEGNLYHQLVTSELEWPVLHAGRRNLKGMMNALVPATAVNEHGVSSSHVDPNAESLATKKRAAVRLQREIEKTQELLAQCERDFSPEKIQERIVSLQKTIDETLRDMKELGWCSGEMERILQARADEKRKEMLELEHILEDGEMEKEDLIKALKEYSRSWNKTWNEIKKMRFIGQFFKNLATSETDEDATSETDEDATSETDEEK